MKSFKNFAQKTVCSLLIFALAFGGIVLNHASAEETSANAAYVYYVTDGDLYRVKTTGGASEKINANFFGQQAKQAGDYLFYLFNEGSTTLLKISLSSGTKELPRRVIDEEVLHFETSGDYVYYLDGKGRIYRTTGAATNKSEAKLVTDMVDKRFPDFSIVNGRVYYNALKDGRTTWVASKAVDGSGSVQWVAAGSIESSYYVKPSDSTLYLMVNTKPEERYYSLDSMVMYYLPIGGGTAKAVNAKAPLDANAVNSGSWVKDGYVYNKGIKLSGDDYNYNTGAGHLLTKEGKTVQLNKTGIYEIVNFGTDKLAYVDAKGKTSVATIAKNKVTSTKPVSVTDAGYIRNLISGGKVKSTVVFASSGAYVLNNDLSTKKLVGVEWDYCTYKENVPGIFYINAGDNQRLYLMNEDGKTTVKLTDDKINRIVLIHKAQ